VDEGPRAARDVGELLAGLERRAYAVQRDIRQVLDSTPQGHPAHAVLEQAATIAGAYWRGVLTAYEAIEVTRKAGAEPAAPQGPAPPGTLPESPATRSQAQRELERNLQQLRNWETHHGIAPREREN
jgi:hypothetical protein